MGSGIGRKLSYDLLHILIVNVEVYGYDIFDIPPSKRFPRS